MRIENTIGEGWIIWHHEDHWTNDAGEISVMEYLDEQGRYCVSVIEPQLFSDGETWKGETWEYDAVVTGVDLLAEGNAAIYVLPTR
jgi:hypothetical protein